MIAPLQPHAQGGFREEQLLRTMHGSNRLQLDVGKGKHHAHNRRTTSTLIGKSDNPFHHSQDAYTPCVHVFHHQYAASSSL